MYQAPSHLFVQQAKKAGRGLEMTLLDHNPVRGGTLPIPSGNESQFIDHTCNGHCSRRYSGPR